MTIEVVDEPPIIDYVEEEFVLYANVTEVSIEAISSGGDVIGFSVSPELDNEYFIMVGGQSVFIIT